MMSLHNIRPSSGEGGTLANCLQSISERTGSDPRRSGGAESISSINKISSKRRRVPKSLTRNACLNCRRARGKCDGEQPCKRCVSRGENITCIYEPHTKSEKGELVRQVKELKAKNHAIEQILRALLNVKRAPEILDQLKNGKTHESIVEWLGPMPMEDFETLSPSQAQHSRLDASDHDVRRTKLTTFQWTSVTSETAVLDHLFHLYFAWVHPVYTLFSESYFIDSYRRRSEIYCSSILVNAICAMACHMHLVTDADEVDFERLATEFSDAVRAGITADDKSITTIQALAVMFLVDCAGANSLRASSYLKVAIEDLASLDFLEIDGYPEVWKNTVCGVRNLNVEWAQMTFQIPSIVHSTRLKPIEEKKGKIIDSKWHFYRYMNEQCLAYPSLLVTTNREKSKLIEIINDISIMMYSQHGPALSAHDVLQQYNRLAIWHTELPSIIENIEGDSSQALPHVLSLLILHSTSVVQLLRPLLDLEGFKSPLVEQTIWDHAQRGLFLLDEYYRKYDCRHQPVLQLFAILHLTDVIARFFPRSLDIPAKDGPMAIEFGIEALMQSRTGYAVAGPLLYMLRRTANECSIRLPRHLDKLIPGPPSRQLYHTDDLIDACTRSTYVQPINQIHQRYLSMFSSDWTMEEPSYGLLGPSSNTSKVRFPPEERGAHKFMHIRNLVT